MKYNESLANRLSIRMILVSTIMIWTMASFKSPNWLYYLIVALMVLGFAIQMYNPDTRKRALLTLVGVFTIGYLGKYIINALLNVH